MYFEFLNREPILKNEEIVSCGIERPERLRDGQTFPCLTWTIHGAFERVDKLARRTSRATKSHLQF
jgi:hypothetical protein